ncbi:cyclin-J18 isoform X2 [Cucumis melo var. makuwa]|uniref:Cyclin-J18 isoform X2 n=1 Tax=Cucumis melo var. makuwa TaxID=1194695 RepID=A0A5A7SSH3_CUCMM|nr:cyclin-J18 isoform X2 [Cucumis melo var. makuwa]
MVSSFLPLSLTFVSVLNRFSCKDLEVPPIVKYSALSLFADRFYSSISGFTSSNDSRYWLLQPITESNLQLFALVSLWISSKLHTSHPLSIKLLKAFGDTMIKEQHFMTRDFLDAILNFEIGTANITFIFLEELLNHFKEVAKVGELVNWEACMDVMDLLYEREETSVFYGSPCSLAAAILVASYLITVPVQEWEFPIVPWVSLLMPVFLETTLRRLQAQRTNSHTFSQRQRCTENQVAVDLSKFGFRVSTILAGLRDGVRRICQREAAADLTDNKERSEMYICVCLLQWLVKSMETEVKQDCVG